ncbi:hypothetical protein SEVIR_2G438950v4 [Setaria viridis]
MRGRAWLRLSGAPAAVSPETPLVRCRYGDALSRRQTRRRLRACAQRRPPIIDPHVHVHSGLQYRIPPAYVTCMYTCVALASAVLACPKAKILVPCFGVAALGERSVNQPMQRPAGLRWR